MRHPSCDHGEEGILAAGECAFNFDRSFLEGCIRIQKTERTRSFRSYPIASGICVADHGHACAALLSESSKVATPLLDTASSGCLAARKLTEVLDRKSTRLNSSHSQISYAVFCLKKKKKTPSPILRAGPATRTRKNSPPQ